MIGYLHLMKDSAVVYDPDFNPKFNFTGFPNFLNTSKNLSEEGFLFVVTNAVTQFKCSVIDMDSLRSVVYRWRQGRPDEDFAPNEHHKAGFYAFDYRSLLIGRIIFIPILSRTSVSLNDLPLQMLTQDPETGA